MNCCVGRRKQCFLNLVLWRHSNEALMILYSLGATSRYQDNRQEAFMSQRSPTSERDKQLFAMPEVAASFPMKFSNGVVWSQVYGNCHDCDKVIPSKFFRGSVTRPLERMADIECVGLCQGCSVVTRFRIRLYDDMSASSLLDNGWERFAPNKPSTLVRLRKAIWRLLGFS